MKRLAFLCLGVALLAACRKDDIIITNSVTLTGPSSVLRAAAPPVQRFTFDLNQPQRITTREGATLSFGANAFVLPNGTVATGQAEVRLREVHSVGDMVLAGLHTDLSYRQNNLLVSAGEFNLQVWQGTTRLQWSQLTNTSFGTQATLATPVPASGLGTNPMFLWKLPFAANGALPVVADSASGWQPGLIVGPALPIWHSIPPSSGLYTAALPLDSISWINFDQFWQSTSATSSAPWTWNRVRVPAGASETVVYIRPAGYTSLCRTFATNDPTLWENHFPNGTDVQVIALQIRDGQFYFGTQSYTWQANTLMAPTLQALSAAELVQRIRQL